MSQAEIAQLNEIATELEVNVDSVIAKAKTKAPCDKLVKNFMTQLAEKSFTKLSIRKVLPAKIRAIREKYEGQSFGKLEVVTHGKEYRDSQSGELTRKEYRQHYLLRQLHLVLDKHGLVTGNASGCFTLEEPTVNEVKAEVTESKTESKAKREKVKKTDIETKVGELVAIDFKEYLKIAKSLLSVNDWVKNCIGVAMAIPRRGVEIGSAMEFFEDDTYSIVVSTPTKKRGEKGTYYLLPCFINSSIVVGAINNIRRNKPEVLSDVMRSLGMEKEANAAFNNDERKRVEEVYNEVVRTLLPSNASSKSRDNQHQLKNIGTSTISQIKSNSVGNLVGQKHLIEEWVREAVGHSFKGTTDKYLTWNVANIPEELMVIADKKYGLIPNASDYLGVVDDETEENTIEGLVKRLLNQVANDSDKLATVTQLFTDGQGNVKSTKEIVNGLERVLDVLVESKPQQTKIHKALGLKPEKSKNELRIEALIDAIILHNEIVDDSLKVFISDSSLRGFYSVFPSSDGSEATININTVKNILDNNGLLKVKIDDANKNMTNLQNLRWRKAKDRIIDSILELLRQNYPNVL